MDLQGQEYTSRRKRFRKLMLREGLEGLFITRLADVRYLCGFSGSNGVVLMLANRGYFLTDFRYKEQSAEEVKGLKVVVYEDSLDQTLARLLRGHLGLRLGFDPDSLTHSEVLILRRTLKDIARLHAVKESFTMLRARKSRAEVGTIEEAIRLSQKAFQEALSGYMGDIRERDLAISLDMAARRMGADGQSFETIVAGGPRGAMVHAAPSARKVRGMTVVDWGVSYHGYCTDITRTLAFGRVSPALHKVHDLVLEAQRSALDKIRPGVRASEVDQAARDLIEAAGYGPYFGHSLGHGVGLEVHERPHVGNGSGDVLEEGMIFTVEPGIYLPGIGGVRVEDMVVVTSHGADVLTTLPRGIDPSQYLV